MKDEIEQIKKEAKERVNNVQNESELAEVEKEYLGRKGKLTSVLRGVKDLTPEEKKEVGKMANQAKEELTSFLEEKKQTFQVKGKETFTDVTLPGQRIERGHLNPLTLVQN